MGSMLMNIAASLLGLGNAATPLGLKAMRDLETLNPLPGTATNAMCTYLAINTSSVQLIPATAIAVLAANNSANPTAIVGTSIIATSCAAVAAVTTAKLLAHLPVFRWTGPGPVVGPPPDAASPTPGSATNHVVRESTAIQPMRWWGWMVLVLFGAFLLGLFLHLAGAPSSVPPAGAATGLRSGLIRGIDALSLLSIPFLLSVIPLYATLRHVKVYEEFVEGAREGFDVAVRIIPYLVAILVAAGMFRAAGGIDLLSHALGPVMRAFGFPPDLLPMVLMRPLSGSGTLGLFAELVKEHGPDSLISRIGGTIYGSTETTFYVLAVYFGSVGVRKTRHAVIGGLTGDLVGVIASVIICRAVFR